MAIRRGGAQLNIADGVRAFAVSSANSAAVVDGERTLTFGVLGERSSRVASALLDAGVRPGERVAVVLGNRFEYLEIAAGLAKAGVVMVPINPRLTGREVGYILDHADVRGLIAAHADAAVIGPFTEARAFALTWELDGSDFGSAYETTLAEARNVDPLTPVAETDPFVVAYTSGTTGRPKGVEISHRSRCLTFLGSALDWGLGPGRRTLAVAPLYHGAGFAFAYAATYCGATVVLQRRWDPEGMLAAVAQHRINSVFLVPTHGQMLRALGEETIGRYQLHALETLYFNAAAMPHPLKEWVLDTFPGVGLHEVYGSTEAGVVTCLRPEFQLTRRGSVGPAWFLTELQLRDTDGQPVVPGELGELYSRSPYLMNGYLDDAEATAACTTEDGFLTAGDVARMDEDGFVSIVDRTKDMIVTGGVNVYPREVEDVLVTHPDIAQAAVAGVADEQWGEAVGALLVLTPDTQLAPEDVTAFCREHLAGFKIPKVIRFAATLPASPTGKILKTGVREQLSAPTDGTSA